MLDTATKIAAGLEQAFAARGFAETNVEALRDAAGVSLRTLYKYTPSRDDMVLVALEHRHQRYMAHVFSDVDQRGRPALELIIDRISAWMEREAPHGCLFHAAVAAAPKDQRLQDLLKRHKQEVAEKAADLAEIPSRCDELAFIIEGLTQSWSLKGPVAGRVAKSLATGLMRD